MCVKAVISVKLQRCRKMFEAEDDFIYGGPGMQPLDVDKNLRIVWHKVMENTLL